MWITYARVGRYRLSADVTATGPPRALCLTTDTGELVAGLSTEGRTPANLAAHLALRAMDLADSGDIQPVEPPPPWSPPPAGRRIRIGAPR